MYAIVYNLVRLGDDRISSAASFVVDRVSFIDALRWLREGAAGPDLAALIVNPE